ncbi:MAG: low molecular weight protein-tyrosine-phosphatase [Bacteroidota bacterium]
MVKVLFVCLGNICRSPMAEGLFIHQVAEAGLSDQFEIDSAGTSGWHEGERADSRMRQTAGKYGIDLPSRSRPVKDSDFRNFDYILAMDESNLRDLQSRARNVTHASAHILKMRQFDDEAPNADVPDPYYGGRRGFDEVYEMLNRSTQQLLTHIQQASEL